MFAERSAFAQEYFERIVLSEESAWLATIVASSYTELAEIPKRRAIRAERCFMGICAAERACLQRQPGLTPVIF
jgi:hypothetical protein